MAWLASMRCRGPGVRAGLAGMLAAATMAGAAMAGDLARDDIVQAGPVPLSDSDFPFGLPDRHQSCTIMVGAPGAMAAGIGRDQLSSTLIGGRPGTATVTATNSSYTMTYEAPAVFSSMPAGNNGAIAFSGRSSGNGATDFMNVPAGDAVRIKRGTTSVTLDLSATINGSTFVSGDYRAEAVLRCE